MLTNTNSQIPAVRTKSQSGNIHVFVYKSGLVAHLALYASTIASAMSFTS